jgi:hypothetical protein
MGKIIYFEGLEPERLVKFKQILDKDGFVVTNAKPIIYEV